VFRFHAVVNRPPSPYTKGSVQLHIDTMNVWFRSAYLTSRYFVWLSLESTLTCRRL